MEYDTLIKEELQNLNEGGARGHYDPNEGDEEDLQAFDAFMNLPADSRLPTGKIAADEGGTEASPKAPPEVALMEDLWDMVVRAYKVPGMSKLAYDLQKLLEAADPGHERLMPRGEGTPGV